MYPGQTSPLLLAAVGRDLNLEKRDDIGSGVGGSPITHGPVIGGFFDGESAWAEEGYSRTMEVGPGIPVTRSWMLEPSRSAL